MIEVVQAFDRAPIAELPTDDAAALERKLVAARKVFADRGGWLKTHQRIDILRRLVGLMQAKRDHLALQIAREGGKPLADARVETDRAIDGVRNAAEELRVMAGQEVPMGLTPAADGRRAFSGGPFANLHRFVFPGFGPHAAGPGKTDAESGQQRPGAAPF